MTIRVAVTGISGDVGVGVIRGLRDRIGAAEEGIWILGLDAHSDCPARAMVDNFVCMPPVADESYVDVLTSVLRSHSIDVLLPGIDSEILTLSRARQRIATISTRIAIAPSPLVEVAADKLLTARFLTSRGIGVPATYDTIEHHRLEFPLIAKPRHGQGSKGIFVLNDAQGLRAFLDEGRPAYCLQKYIEGPEVTVGFLYDWNGVLQDAIAMERALENGRTVRATVIRWPNVLQFIDAFGSRIAGAGAINAQLRIHQTAGPQVFEINARLSGSTGMRVMVGFNDPLRIVRHLARGIPMKRSVIREGTIYRGSTDLVLM